MTDDLPSAPVACSLTAAGVADRLTAWRGLADRALRGRRAVPGGVEVVYRAGDDVEASLRELALLEADCCAFAEWAVERRGGDLVLIVTAEQPAGAEAVRAMFAASEGPDPARRADG